MLIVIILLLNRAILFTMVINAQNLRDVDILAWGNRIAHIGVCHLDSFQKYSAVFGFML